MPVPLGQAADVLPTNVLQSLDVHVELALGEGTRCRDEPALLDAESSSPHTCLPSAAIRALTTFPRVMWKEPDSVFSNTEEVNSVFRALGVKSARMSILERMRWGAQDKHVGFQQDPVTTPGLLQRGHTLPCACSPAQEVPTLCPLWEPE